MIKHCTKCHDYRSAGAQFQDKAHGVGKRVQNPIQGKSTKQYRCTICESTT